MNDSDKIVASILAAAKMEANDKTRPFRAYVAEIFGLMLPKYKDMLRELQIDDQGERKLAALGIPAAKGKVV
ncbi:hypothetical protein [Roseiarcus sp.]|uniref:hypothetical protein n=1 Tax=Roseiarcus sp. TaxID=1969460 RepID=UPI003D0ED0DB